MKFKIKIIKYACNFTSLYNKNYNICTAIYFIIGLSIMSCETIVYESNNKGCKHHTLTGSNARKAIEARNKAKEENGFFFKEENSRLFELKVDGRFSLYNLKKDEPEELLCNIYDDIYQEEFSLDKINRDENFLKKRILSLGIKKIGEGSYGRVYNIGNDYVVKFFLDGSEALDAYEKYEKLEKDNFPLFKNNTTHEFVLPEKCYKIKNSYCFIYKKVDGETMHSILCKDFFKKKDFQKTIFELMDYIFKTRIFINDYYSNRLMHNDLHPGNVIYKNGKYYVLDNDMLEFKKDSQSLKKIEIANFDEFSILRQEYTKSGDVYYPSCFSSLLTEFLFFNTPCQSNDHIAMHGGKEEIAFIDRLYKKVFNKKLVSKDIGFNINKAEGRDVEAQKKICETARNYFICKIYGIETLKKEFSSRNLKFLNIDLKNDFTIKKFIKKYFIQDKKDSNKKAEDLPFVWDSGPGIVCTGSVYKYSKNSFEYLNLEEMPFLPNPEKKYLRIFDSEFSGSIEINIQSNNSEPKKDESQEETVN